MNIIKFKDVLLTTCESLSDTEIEIFNEKLRGKYAYWIKMSQAVALEDMLPSEYEEFETSVKSLEDSEYCYIDIPENWREQSYIDTVATDEVNSINNLVMLNNQVPIDSLTLDDIKQFRTWLATELLLMDIDPFTEAQLNVLYTPEQTHMLQYYAGGMYSEVIKYLSMFDDNVTVTKAPVSGCGCCGATMKLNYTYNENIPLNPCDPIKIYRENIYKAMVTMFSDINFWNERPEVFLKNFKLYIDCIINSGLPLSQVEYNTTFQIAASAIEDCSCGMQNIDDKFINILRNLSKSLEYLIKNELNGHKNFISKSFNDWASLLYENMAWNVNAGDETIVISSCCHETYTKDEIDSYIEILDTLN